MIRQKPRASELAPHLLVKTPSGLRKESGLICPRDSNEITSPHRLRVVTIDNDSSILKRQYRLKSDHALGRDRSWFELTALAASEHSAGKQYSYAANWRLSSPLLDEIRAQHGRAAAGASVLNAEFILKAGLL